MFEIGELVWYCFSGGGLIHMICCIIFVRRGRGLVSASLCVVVIGFYGRGGGVVLV